MMKIDAIHRQPHKKRGMGVAPALSHRASAAAEAPARLLPGGFDEVNKKYTGPGDAPPGQSIVNGTFKFAYLNLNLIFWGNEWSAPSPPVPYASIVAAVQNIRSGTYLHGLAQYGFINAWVNKVFVIGGDPPNPFTNANVQGFVYGLIDNETLPEPDEETYYLRQLHVVFTPSYSAFVQPNPARPINGYHSFFAWNDYDLGDIDNSDTYYAWIQNNGTLNGIAQTFSHELVEAITDPDGSGLQVVPSNPTNWNEIGDVCQTAAVINGVNVQSYWSQADQACIIPTYIPPPPPPQVDKNTQLQIISIRKYYSSYINKHYIAFVGAIDHLGSFWALSRSEVIDLIQFNGNTFIVKGADGSQSNVVVESHFITTTADTSREDNLLSLPTF